MVRVTAQAATKIVLIPAAASFARFKRKPSRIIPRRRNLLEIKAVPGLAACRSPAGVSCMAIPSKRAITSAPIRLI